MLYFKPQKSFQQGIFSSLLRRSFTQINNYRIINKTNNNEIPQTGKNKLECQ
jgi:hypothetical protein